MCGGKHLDPSALEGGKKWRGKKSCEGEMVKKFSLMQKKYFHFAV